MKEPGDGFYDELGIDEEDYENLPAYEFYKEVVDNREIARPELVRNYHGEPEEYNSPAEKEAEEMQKAKAAADFETALQITYDIMVRAGKYGLAKPDYSGLGYYREAFLDFVKNKLPEEIEDYLRRNSKDYIPRSRINRNRMLKYIFRPAKRYRKQYKNRLYPRGAACTPITGTDFRFFLYSHRLVIPGGNSTRE